jgi:hypothetical protein
MEYHVSRSFWAAIIQTRPVLRIFFHSSESGAEHAMEAMSLLGVLAGIGRFLSLETLLTPMLRQGLMP